MMNMKTIRIAALAAAALTAAASLADIRSVTPVAWDGKADCWQMKRHAEKMAEIAKTGGAKVVFIGDSITHYWESHGKRVWRHYFANGERRALNLGTSADRTEHVLWRLENGELDGYEAKAILLMIGTNNTGHRSRVEEPPVDTILGVKRILDVIAEKQPKARTILTAIFPRGADETDERRVRNNIINKELAKFADDKKVIWCDFSDKYLDAQGRLSRELFPDLLHPNERGYQIWASAVIPLIDEILDLDDDEADERIPSVWPSSPRGYDYGEPFAAHGHSMFPSGNWWGTRCLEKRNEIAENGGAEYDLVMVGDSITHRWEREGGEGRALYQELKKTYRMLNLGYGGDRTENVIWRLENGELDGYTAKLFQVMIGTNNSYRDKGNPADVAAGVRRILDLIRAKHPESKIVLLPIFPRGKSADDANRLTNEKVNAIIKGFADGENIVWHDFNANFFNAEGLLTKQVMNDLLHPNERGYQIWLDAMLPVFRQYCGK